MHVPEQFLPDSEEVLQNSFVSVQYSEADSLLLLKWKRQIDFEERKEIFLWAYQFSKDKQVRNWLIDDEEIFIFTTQEKDWIENDWTELVADSGIRKLAVCTPDYYNILATLTDFTQRAQDNYQRYGNTQHEVFIDYPTALTWLRSK